MSGRGCIGTIQATAQGAVHPLASTWRRVGSRAADRARAWGPHAVRLADIGSQW